MPAYIVTFKKDSPQSEIDTAKKAVTDNGGKITQEYSLIKGFSYTVPEGQISALESNPHVESLENDGEVSTQ